MEKDKDEMQRFTELLKNPESEFVERKRMVVAPFLLIDSAQWKIYIEKLQLIVFLKYSALNDVPFR